jgi:hypothetical protein
MGELNQLISGVHHFAEIASFWWLWITVFLKRWVNVPLVAGRKILPSDVYIYNVYIYINMYRMYRNLLFHIWGRPVTFRDD